MKSTEAPSTAIDAYIATFPGHIQVILMNMRQTIRIAAPGAVEVIAYGMPTFRLNGKNLAHFAAMKHHIGFYPTPSAIVAFKKELTAYKTSKGAIQFPTGTLMPYGLVAAIVKFRVTEVSARK